MTEKKQTLNEVNIDIEILDELDLFAEDLPERINTSVISGTDAAGKWSCVSTVSTAISTASTFCTVYE